MNHSSFRKLQLLLLIGSLLCLSACGKKETCAYCGEAKYCTEYDLVGVTRLICDDCLNQGVKAVTSPGIMEEYGVIIPETPVSEDTDTENPEVSASDTPSTSLTPAVSDNTAPQFTTTLSKDDIVTALSAYYSESGMELKLSENNRHVYELYAGEEYQGINFLFTPVAEGQEPPLSVLCYDGASSTGYTAACIRSAITYLGSNDYSGLGYEIYNTATAYGSHQVGNTKFYYKASSAQEIENGAPVASFDILR